MCRNPQSCQADRLPKWNLREEFVLSEKCGVEKPISREYATERATDRFLAMSLLARIDRKHELVGKVMVGCVKVGTGLLIDLVSAYRSNSKNLNAWASRDRPAINFRSACWPELPLEPNA